MGARKSASEKRGGFEKRRSRVLGKEERAHGGKER